MHAKYALALILALQVSVSLCDLPPPSQELVDKYNDMKATFTRRITNLVERIQPLLTETEDGKAIMECIDNTISSSHYQAFQKVVEAMINEFTPLVDSTRMDLLARYEYTLRPQIGDYLSRGIEILKVFLDKFMPAN